MTMTPTPFIAWWRQLNAALECRGEPEALYGEARDAFALYPSRTVSPWEPRVLNRIVNARKPL